jgi:hypothetical protein
MRRTTTKDRLPKQQTAVSSAVSKKSSKLFTVVLLALLAITSVGWFNSHNKAAFYEGWANELNAELRGVYDQTRDHEQLRTQVADEIQDTREYLKRIEDQLRAMPGVQVPSNVQVRIVKEKGVLTAASDGWMGDHWAAELEGRSK